jgi:surface antigen
MRNRVFLYGSKSRALPLDFARAHFTFQNLWRIPVLLSTIALSACSMAMPSLWGDKGSAPKIADNTSVDKTTTTGSVLQAQPKSLFTLFPDLNEEDGRRAKGALGLALDPVGSGAAVKWDNPDSKRQGSFIPVGQPFVKNDEICRVFLSSVTAQSAASDADVETSKGQNLQGTACRPSGGEWTIKEIQPWRKGA